jgi:hypothetical protein
MLSKRRRTGTCVDCGGTTRYGGQPGKPVSERCVRCANERRRTWSEERILAAIHRFRVEHGRPPVANDWRYATRPDYAPSVGTVQAVFGTWRIAIVAAGFPDPGLHKYERTPEIREKCRTSQRERFARERAAASSSQETTSSDASPQ